ncbi:hypothetical protein SYN63AY4M2_00365 [Synechococcus sp. 63AY4M2]|jgi:hypothetical protein|uniref:hypothetical protein n=1 Tax=unclassified Synechococcus TaxID=2626047 RepID=UPI000069443F|nr:MULTISPECIES: hypothetical protein [unclassified Synechococcus]PIK92736.1 hypothetical protein SYN65AY6LI_11240 [Synechococcus sp. 65AY6Li]ABC99668.1 hypothetical protein CYA_1501 [Synechococcus sp. JA-3-3Ab]PIK85052.1 hypothetical protein SYN63AY4M2_00365 [Synechococcus sp. 63AY4M2]PIK88300.1 hypothetical protein SYN65AY6A5_04040 [Synechococcus sp. 65AY6A5]PIK94093.1 hypothetical protein SYN60AY4M2_00810 [Synechococcus sp. 60AY4M2]
MNASLNSLPVAPALSIEAIVEQVFRSGFLSLQQENLINELLFQRRYSEADLEMLDRLTLALLNQQVEADKPSVAKAA